MPKPPGGLLLRRSRMWRKRGKWLSGLLAAKRDEKWEESVRLAFHTGRRTNDA